MYKQKKLIENLKNEKYDIYLTTIYGGCTLGLFHLLDIPSIVGYLTVPDINYLNKLMGIPTPTSFIASNSFYSKKKKLSSF